MKELVKNLPASYISNTNSQTKWDFLKYEICKYMIKYTKELAKDWKQ